MSDERPASSYPGTPDGFARLWTPHRMAYIDGGSRPSTSEPAECPFCLAPGRGDDDGLIVARGTHTFVVLNLFPYNPGHLLVCPYRHVADLTELTVHELGELAAMTAQGMRALRKACAPAGFNLGMNQGAVAGAGIGAHVHHHVVPRWSGDANFFPIVARTRALPQLLGETRQRLAEAWAALPPEGGTSSDASLGSGDRAKGP
ncbi:MAG: HIT domain-containing protein [Bifidobacteriaceae bacterium]|jgi:ATP adenylyltransferase|nr:HIT domain-containing protein [Bifidobacteriaceae bacterium]